MILLELLYIKNIAFSTQSNCIFSKCAIVGVFCFQHCYWSVLSYSSVGRLTEEVSATVLLKTHNIFSDCYWCPCSFCSSHLIYRVRHAPLSILSASCFTISSHYSMLSYTWTCCINSSWTRNSHKQRELAIACGY